MTRLFTILLALLIAVTSQQMAVARGMMMNAAGQVVICTGHGVQTITIDHQGDPIEVVHICPDCALTLAALAQAPTTAPAPVIHMQVLGQTPVRDLQIPSVPTSAQPRGPPVML